jgi:hypothetical protein
MFVPRHFVMLLKLNKRFFVVFMEYLCMTPVKPMFLVLDRNACGFRNILIAFKGMFPTTGPITKFSFVGFIAIVSEKGDQTCHWWFHL